MCRVAFLPFEYLLTFYCGKLLTLLLCTHVGLIYFDKILTKMSSKQVQNNQYPSEGIVWKIYFGTSKCSTWYLKVKPSLINAF